MPDINQKPMVLTAGLVREYFKRVGVKKLNECPRCGDSQFEDDDDPDDHIYTTYERSYIDSVLSADRIQDKDFGIYSRNCENCGYFEEFYMTPLIRDWLSKNG